MQELIYRLLFSFKELQKDTNTNKTTDRQTDNEQKSQHRQN